MSAQLLRDEQRKLYLSLTTGEQTLQLYVDFLNDKKRYQRPHRGKNELIARAIGLSKGLSTVWDMTAGLAEDAVLMAQIGATVCAFERQPLLAELLRQAQEQAQNELKNQGESRRLEWVKRLSIQSGNSIEFLKGEISDRPQVIYLDPMFEDIKKKTALPRKEMQIFRELVGMDVDSIDLFREAYRVALKRVVVKRALKAPPLVEGVTHSFEGTSVRYDLYAKTEVSF